MTDDLRSPRQFDPHLFLGLAMALGSEDAHKVQLDIDQRSTVHSDTLPKEGLDGLKPFGVEILGPVPGDDLIMYVKLPAGWKQQATSHSMWTDLLDEQGRKRAAMFRGPFYDRGDRLDVLRKYGTRKDYDRCEKTGEVVVQVLSGGKDVVFETAPRAGVAGTFEALERDQREVNYKLGEEAEAEAEAWLNANFPDWKSEIAYW